MNEKELIAYFKSVMAGSKDYSIFATDLNTNITLWNAGAETLYGYSSEEVLGKNIYFLFDPTELTRMELEVIMEEVLHCGSWAGPQRRRKKDGTIFFVHTIITPHLSSDNTIAGYTIISHDITDVIRINNEKEKAYHELTILNHELQNAMILAKEADKTKSEFLANMSHELRTPLNAIIGFSELIYNGKVGPVSPQHKDYLGEVITSGQHLLSLIDQILDLSRIEAKKLMLNPEKIDLKQLIHEVVNEFQIQMAEKDIQCKINVDPSLGEVTLDPDKFKQAVYNYLSNAVKFTPDNGSIYIVITAEMNNMFRLEIHDTGIGISEHDLTRLFIPFQQLEAGTLKKYHGSGLGLALTKSLIETQGGKVGVNSRVGVGSCFYFTLPCVPKVAEKNQLISGDNTQGISAKTEDGVLSILIIERESEDRKILIDTLEKAGFAVETLSVDSVLKQIKITKTYDAIIFDLFLAEISTWNVLRIIRTLKSSVSRSETTLATITSILESANTMGFVIHDFLIKPVPINTMIDSLIWSGAAPDVHKTILLIDDDENNLNYFELQLKKQKYIVTCKKNLSEALTIAREKPPDVIVLNPFISNREGFNFIHRLHETESIRYTPIIIWSAQLLSIEDQEKLKSFRQRIIIERFHKKLSITDELNRRIL